MTPCKSGRSRMKLLSFERILVEWELVCRNDTASGGLIVFMLTITLARCCNFWNTHHTKSDDATHSFRVPTHAGTGEATRKTIRTVRETIVPANDSVLTGLRSRRICSEPRCRRPAPVRAPLGNVAQHVVESPCVWFLPTDVAVPGAAIPVIGGLKIPGNLLEITVARSRGPSSTRIFPLGLGRQSVVGSHWPNPILIAACNTRSRRTK